MPTWDQLNWFRDDLKNLTPQQRELLRTAVAKFVDDLRRGRFRAGLRVKRVQGSRDVWEMTWAADGRCTFQYGDEVVDGEPHIIWRRAGTYDIFNRP
ncbi:hypothetical protein [Pilimelia columellifera]|uniref:Uncharacterized protein n=1 Tax=Pilimelia columellifera subsp. columellifera TaxID=706583 RepID=A0ABN3NMH3_9ACTN